ncbi:HAD-IA family hydrolase [Sanguibacter suaedae]|uniref:HAD family hydrolase n=1 Tax=Sanguibacter suaedae TaxID=2795737 RepID=A0A934IC38_9MICO|nr:HAD-IA family hydrolase [Sanguibacter suaedae]MBI9114144.1 HAD family hydrolase [Sanguibacter suaedae]
MTLQTPPIVPGSRPAPDHRPAVLRRAPAALLLDFGGVVFETRRRTDAAEAVVGRWTARLAAAGHTCPSERLLAALLAGRAALKDWKNAAGRRLEPREMTHREIVRDFLASDLPATVRQVLECDATEVLAEMSVLLSDHVVRPGVRELLAHAQDRGIPVGIVSNAHAGLAHRRLLAQHGLDALVAVQAYSDEIGIRKPHPGTIHRTATALGTTADRCWYVGDTQDRDVVAGRRAGVGAVLVTRHRHTDTPPYPVSVVADAVLETPEGVLDLLRRTLDEQPPEPSAAAVGALPARSAGPSRGRPPAALLLDHGGVVVTSTPDPEAADAFARALSDTLARAGHVVPADRVARSIAHARRTYHAWKADLSDGDVVPETTPQEFWAAATTGWPAGAQELVRLEAVDLMARHARTKSRARLRDGVDDLLTEAARLGVPVAVVSNTVSGRVVRERLHHHGLLERLAVVVCSDEVGRRKPDPELPRTALRALGVDPLDAWFVGDKPHRDALAARRADVGTVVLVRGGSTTDAPLDEALDARASGGTALADHVVDDIHGLLALLTRASKPATPTHTPHER